MPEKKRISGDHRPPSQRLSKSITLAIAQARQVLRERGLSEREIDAQLDMRKRDTD